MASTQRAVVSNASPKRRRAVLAIMTLGIGAVLGVLLVEVGLRATGRSYPRTVRRDDYLGTARIPGISFIHRDEGFSHVRINSEGFRDDEWGVAKPADVVRIAVLGDSYVEALQVEDDERFTELLERQLNQAGAAPARRIQVMNFGMSGFGTAQELMVLRQHVLKYAPDIVVLSVLTTNDIRNNSKALEKDPGRPYFHFVNGELTLDTSFRTTPEHDRGPFYRLLIGATDYSRVLQVAWQVRQWMQTMDRRRELSQGAQRQAGDELGLTAWIYAEPKEDPRREAWRVTEGLLRMMHQEVTARGAAFLVVTMSSGIQVHPDPAVRQQFAERNGIPDLFYPETRIRAAGARDGFRVITLAPDLQVTAEQKNLPLHGFGEQIGWGHWNANGHREAARLLLPVLSELSRSRNATSSAGPTTR